MTKKSKNKLSALADIFDHDQPGQIIAIPKLDAATFEHLKIKQSIVDVPREFRDSGESAANLQIDREITKKESFLKPDQNGEPSKLVQTSSNPVKIVQTSSNSVKTEILNQVKPGQTRSSKPGQTRSENLPDCELLTLWFLNQSQLNGDFPKFKKKEIADSIGFSDGGVDTAIKRLRAKGFLVTLREQRGRHHGGGIWTPTPRGMALLTRDDVLKIIAILNPVKLGQTRSSKLGQTRSTTDRQKFNSVCLSNEWAEIVNNGVIPGMTQEALASDLLALRPDRWTPEFFTEQIRIWSHRKRIDKTWFARIKKSEWKTFVAEMLERGGIDPRPGYRPQETPKPTVKDTAIAPDPEIQQLEQEARLRANETWMRHYEGKPDQIANLIPAALRSREVDQSSLAKKIVLDQERRNLGLDA